MLGRVWIGCLTLLPVITGCVTSGEDVADATATAAMPTAAVSASVAQDRPAVAGRAAVSAAVIPHAAPADDYRLSAQDVIEISVFQVPDLNRTVQINTGGKISLPLIGAVTAAGKTARELEQELIRLYGARYLQSPQISVFVKEYTSQRVTVDGAVNAPGVYQMTGRSTLLQAIAMAKGLDRTGDETGVLIFRMVDGERKGAVFDLREIRSGKREDPVLVGGDTVVVDQSVALTAWRAVRESVGVVGAFRPIWFP